VRPEITPNNASATTAATTPVLTTMTTTSNTPTISADAYYDCQHHCSVKTVCFDNVKSTTISFNTVFSLFKRALLRKRSQL
jgi:hypothetical protein